MVQVAFPRSLFNHSAQLNSSFPRLTGDRNLFQFENAWMKHSDFLRMAKDCWTQTVVISFTGFRIFKKFQVLKVKIKDWRREVLDDIDVRRDSLLGELEEWDREEEERSLEQHEVEANRATGGNLWRLNRMEEVVEAKIHNVMA